MKSVKDLNRLGIYLVVVAMELLGFNLDKFVKHTGIHISAVIYGYLVLFNFDKIWVIYLIMSLFLSVLYIIIVESLRSQIGKARGEELARAMKQWPAYTTLVKTYIVFLAYFNLLLAFIAIMNEAITEVSPIPLALAALSGITILHRIIYAIYHNQSIRQFAKWIKSK